MCDPLLHFMQTYGLLWALNALNALFVLQISDFQEFKTPFRVQNLHLHPPPPSDLRQFLSTSGHRGCRSEAPCLSGNAWGSDTRDHGFHTKNVQEMVRNEKKQDQRPQSWRNASHQMQLG